MPTVNNRGRLFWGSAWTARAQEGQLEARWLLHAIRPPLRRPSTVYQKRRKGSREREVGQDFTERHCVRDVVAVEAAMVV
jgi:hypothetical protein